MSIIVFPRGQLTARDKVRLTKAGIVAIEADDPSRVVCIVPAASMVSADDLLMSALIGMSGGSSSGERSAFASELTRRLRAKESARQADDAALQTTGVGKP